MNKDECIEQEMHYTLSRHAKERLQQRGIPLMSVETMLRYGRKRRRKGAYVLCMDRRQRKLVKARLAPEIYRRVADKLDFYMVYNDRTGEIITVAHRLDRLKW